jgi:hypothetical protein
MADRIITIEITFQSHVSRKSRKNVVRKRSLDGPYRNTIITIPADIQTGSDSGANLAVRKIVFEEIKKQRKSVSGELLFYARAEFERAEKRHFSRYFKTIIPRQKVTI